MIARHSHRAFNKPSPLQLAFRAGEILRIPAGRVLYRMGEPATHVYWLRNGAVKLLKTNERLESRLLHIIGPDHPLGLPDLFVGSYLHTAITLDYSLICRTTREHMLRLCESHPDFIMHVVQRLDQKLRHAEQRIALLAAYPPEERLRYMVYLFYQEFSTDHEGYIRLPLTRKDLAELTGVSPKTISRILKQWEAKGWIRMDKQRIQVLHPEALFHGLEDLP